MEKIHIFMTRDDVIGVHIVASHSREALSRCRSFLSMPRSLTIEGVRRTIELSDLLSDDDDGKGVFARVAIQPIEKHMVDMVAMMRLHGYAAVVVYDKHHVATNVLVGDAPPERQTMTN